MTRTRSFVIVTLFLAGVVASAGQTPTPQPAPQTAGERYRSIRELKEIPATMVIPSMAFVANALGVTCLHCHTDVYESDEKPMKERAREMIRLTRAINQAHFGGKPVVTCETCHHGQAVPATTPPIENAGWNPRPQPPTGPLPEVGVVMSRYTDAVGAAAFDRLQKQRTTGTITRRNGRTADVTDSFELIQTKPASFTLNTTVSHPPEGDAELPMTFLRPARLRATYPDLRATGHTVVDGENTVVLTGTNPRGAVHQLYFSERTGLLVRRTDTLETPLGPLPERYDFSDYRDFDGLKVPMRIVWSRADYQVDFKILQVTHEK